MNRIHVCLVSEQTVPNILSIHHFKPEKIVFCTTDKMEKQKRTDAIINTLKLYDMNYKDTHERIIVDQDCLDDCEIKFSEAARRYSNDEVVINLTGGTKIMVLGAYNSFKSIAKQMIYTPIPKNEFITVFPKDDSCKKPFSYNLKLSVEAYVTAYGVKIENTNKLKDIKEKALNNKDLCSWMAKNYKDIECLLKILFTQLQNARDKNSFDIDTDYNPKSKADKELLNKLGMKNNTIKKRLSKDEIRFLTGDWLSNYCYNEISALSVDDVVTEIELISPKGAKNEFDVMFTKDNALYIVECKSLSSKEEQYQDFLYKISALQQDFGLRVNGFMISTTRDILDNKGEIKPHIKKRAEQCSTNIIHPDEISNVSEFIKTHVKGLN